VRGRDHHYARPVRDHDVHRLSRSIAPRRYDLVLEPDLPAATFRGTVDIEVDVAEPVREVVLNAIELDLLEAAVEQDGRQLAVAAIRLDADTERATLVLHDELAAGQATVRISFSGILNDKLHGFYRSRFTDVDGVDQVIATTQFEATDARRAFPCFDEPDFKAVFAITLVVEGDLLAVSNTRVLADEPLGDGRRRVRFSDSMPMSTYLVAFIVGPLEATEPRDVDGTPVRILCPPGKLHLAPFGLDVAEFSLRYLADYFDLPYPGETLDLVAIPDFAFGAMENLGCVTFRETLLLADPGSVTQPELQNVVDVIAHELAHMWFGDLVTMKWWNGIWLNEAFATFMELKVTDAFRPEWERWVGFGLARTSAFDTDALGSTRPVEYPVISPHDAEGMFDVLTYEKGAAVVRMLEQYLGDDRFRQGIRRYMLTHQYGNTETTDLWDAIEEVTAEPVRRIMDSWIFQGGYPIVEVDVQAEGRVLHLSQERFRYPSHAEDDDDGSLWAVPLVLRYGNGDGQTKVTTALLDGTHLEIDLPEPIDWVVGNVEGNGFYRVRYSAPLRAALVARAQDELSALERYGLVDDTWASVLAGTTAAAEFLDLAEGFTGETDVSVWRRIIAGLDHLERIARHDEATVGQLRERIGSMLRPAYDRLGPEPSTEETDRERELRSVLLGALGTLAHDDNARHRAADVFSRYGEDPGAVEANLAAAAIRVVASTAGPAEFDALLAGFRGASTPQEEQRFLYSLADVRDPEQFGRVLELAMSDDVRTQNAPFLVGACLANRVNGALAWRFVRERWADMNDRFPSNSIVRMLSGIRSISDGALAADIQGFLAEHPVPQAIRTMEQHVERMTVSVALAGREGPRS
jgi:puromycin-sensitive aminopeptidase